MTYQNSEKKSFGFMKIFLPNLKCWYMKELLKFHLYVNVGLKAKGCHALNKSHKESPRDVTLRQGVENIWIFARFWRCWENPSKSLRAAEKSQGPAEKNKEKVEATCTGFSAEFFGSQSVEMFCFARKTKNQMLTTSSLQGAWQESTNVFLNP